MCTSIMAGNQATAGGLILLSRNEDFTRNNWNKYMVFRGQAEYKLATAQSNGIWTLGNGLSVPVPDQAYRYCAMPDAMAYDEATYAIGDRYFFEERGVNEKNFAISATNSLTINDKAQKADPLLETGGIAESVIPTLLLPQADSAVDGVRLLGHYVEQYGASEVNGVLLGDPQEAWYFEIGSAHHWIAVRVPQDAYIVVANGMRVHGVDLDSGDVLCSEGLYEFVVINELLDLPDRHDFNFAKAFGIPGVPYNVDRVWLAQSILTPSRQQQPRLEQYPLFLRPDKAIEVEDVMQVLRATYQGTVLEGKADRPIGYERTAESHIITVDPAMPHELKGLIWQAVSTPLGAPYMPFYAVMDDIPPAYAMGSNQYGPLSAYWTFRGLYTLAETGRNTFLPELHAHWADYEGRCLNENPYVQRLLTEIYGNDQSTALAFARRYSTGIAYETLGLANRYRDTLMTQITVQE